MRYLLRLSLAFVLVGLTLAAAGFLLPRRYHAGRTVTIAAPPDRVYPLIGDISRWREWNVWFTRDPGMELRFSAATSGAGAWAAWRSARQGAGRLELQRVRAPEEVEYRLVPADLPVVSIGTLQVVGAAGGGRTIVTWRSEGDLGYSPVTRWFGLFLGPLFGADMEAGLEALRKAGEKN